MNILATREAELKEAIQEIEWDYDAGEKPFVWEPSAKYVTEKETFSGVGLRLIVEEEKPILDVEAAEKLARKKELKWSRRVFDEEIFLANVQAGAITEKELRSVMKMSNPKKPYVKIITVKPME
jgi:hypothetical protein